jgi:GntP family gluconate:H+ symporter
MTTAITILAANELVEPVAAGWQLILAALAGIALIVVLITVAKLHPFLALIFGAVTVALLRVRTRGMSSTRSARDSATPPPRWAS